MKKSYPTIVLLFILCLILVLILTACATKSPDILPDEINESNQSGEATQNPNETADPIPSEQEPTPTKADIPVPSNAILADQIEIPDFFKHAVQTRLSSYQDYKQSGVPFLPAPVEQLCYGELKVLKEDVASGDPALLEVIDNQISLIEQSMGGMITADEKLDLNGDGQIISIVNNGSKITIAGMRQYDISESTDVKIREVIIGEEPQVHGIYIMNTMEETIQANLIFGKDNAISYNEMEYYFTGDYRFDSSGDYTLEVGECYPVEMMSTYLAGQEGEPALSRISYMTVSFCPNEMVSNADAIVLPGMNGEAVTFFANEKLWVIDSRSRYVALMNENGDVGFLIVGKYDDTIEMSESDRYASMVDYVLYNKYYIMLDNQGNSYYLMEMFEGFNCMS